MIRIILHSYAAVNKFAPWEIGDWNSNSSYKWKLERPNAKIPVTTDNAQNIVNASKQAGMSPHIGCFAHTLNLATQKGLGVNQMSRILGKVRRIVAFFHRSTTAAASFNSRQKDLKLNPHKLVQDVFLTWNSIEHIVGT